MSDQTVPTVSKWPFCLGEALLLGGACFVCFQSPRPLGMGPLLLIVACVVAGAVLAAVPFILEYRAKVKLAEAGELATVVSQIQTIEAAAAQISTATGQWKKVQEQSDQTVAAAREVTERITAESQGFTEFLKRVNDDNKAGLRLEVDKLRRAESEWLQVLVRVLDHVYALHAGALRSGQPNLIEQLGLFQNACREAARRVGLTPFHPDPSEPFDGQRHQVVKGNGPPPPGASVAETVAAGYTFQGKLLRPAIVRLTETETAEVLDPVAAT